MALRSIGKIYPEKAESYATLFYNRNKYIDIGSKYQRDSYQKSMALEVLQTINSPLFKEYLQKAQYSDYDRLRVYAENFKP